MESSSKAAKREERKEKAAQAKVVRYETDETKIDNDEKFVQVTRTSRPNRKRKLVQTENKSNLVNTADVEMTEEAAGETSQSVDMGEKSQTNETEEPSPKKPSFPEISSSELRNDKIDTRKVRIPNNRYTALKEKWLDIYNPIVKQLGLQTRFNLKNRHVELRTCSETRDIGALQKGQDFVKAFAAGFEVEDALALVRLDDLFMESFQVEDVKTLRGDHLSRAIGRIAGKGGKTKFTIENVTKTRIVMQDSKINILGTYHNIAAARRAICSLIMGSPPSKVYGTMRAIAAKSGDHGL